MKHTGLLCLKCGTVIFSRARHDFVKCTCGAVAIDGGFDYYKIIGSKNKFKTLTLNLPKTMTKKNLYDSWNKFNDTIGTYKVGEWEPFIRKAILEEQN